MVFAHPTVRSRGTRWCKTDRLRDAVTVSVPYDRRRNEGEGREAWSTGVRGDMRKVRLVAKKKKKKKRTSKQTDFQVHLAAVTMARCGETRGTGHGSGRSREYTEGA